MSTPILPFAVWQSGTNQNSIPANDNALRSEILSAEVIAMDVEAQPEDPQGGDLYIIPAGATGDQWSLFDPDDLALFRDGNWYAYSPVAGLLKMVAGTLYQFAGSGGWEELTVPTDAPVSSVNGLTGAVSLGLGGLDDVDATGASDGDVLTWDNSAGEWVPGAPSGGGGSDVDVNTPTNSSGTVTLDFAGKSRYIGAITLGANVTTLAFSNLPGAGKYAEYELHIAQDGTGSRTFAIPASHKALGGSDTTIASAASAVTVLSASTVDNGTTWRYAMQESA